MSAADHNDEQETGLVVATITITRTLTSDDLIDRVTAADDEGNELGLAEALGMMRLAEDTLLRARLDDEDDDE